eukprot:tig00020941_g16221.t1
MKGAIGGLPPAAEEESSPEDVSPEERAGPISRITFGWATYLLARGNRQVLEFEDLPPVREDVLTERVWRSWKREWERELQLRPERPSLYRSLWRVYRGTLAVTGMMQFSYWAVAVGNPLIMREILKFVVDPRAERWHGYALAAALFVAPLIGAFVNAHSLLLNFRSGMEMRSALSAEVYRKALVLDNGARQGATVGQITNLMATDCQRFAEVSLIIQMLWIAPLVIFVVLGLLIWVIGWQALVGVALMLVLFPINGFIAARTAKLRALQTKLSDERVAVMNEVVQGIRVIKFYAWEQFFLAKVDEVRGRECRLLLHQAYLRACIVFLMFVTPSLTALVTFATYSLTEGEMQPYKVFTALALFNVLRLPLTYFPVVLSMVAQLKVAVRRIVDFLLLPEMQAPPPPAAAAGDREPGAFIRGGTFQWDAAPPKKAEAPPRARKGRRPAARCRPAANSTGPRSRLIEGAQVEDEKAAERSTPQEAGREGGGGGGPGAGGVDFEARAGQLVAVVGPVGSGKSSLVSALLGDMRRLAGEAGVTGRIAYVAQQAWIINASLRENVLFGSPVDEERYRSVLAACALEQDIAALPAGDQTEIGEKGINLSGGQKQRVSLARAVYADADVYILDDPLSAVDAHVGRHLFERCVCGALAKKTRVLVTNQLHFVHAADRIYVLKAGRVAEAGTYDELMAGGQAFAELMAAYGHGKHQRGAADEGEGEGEGPEAAPGESAGTAGAEKAGEKGGGGGGEKGGAGGGAGTLVLAETKASGRVSVRVYAGYLSAAGGAASFLLLLLLYVLGQGTMAGNGAPRFIQPDPGERWYLALYAGWSGALALTVFARALAFAAVTVRAARNLYHAMALRVLRAPMSFFDTTPAGRILNRFSKDTDQVDQLLATSAEQFFNTLFGLLSIIGIVCGYLPWLLIAVAPLGALYFYVQRFYRRTSTELQRLESVSKSPVYTNFGETLTGVSTIRAYGVQERFTRVNDERTDKNNRAFYMMQVANRWLNLRLDAMSACILLIVAMLSVSGREAGINAGTAGLVLAYSLSITQVLSMTVRFSAELEGRMSGVERQLEYSGIPVEAAAVVKGRRPPAEWPVEGRVEVEGLVMRYREGLDPVLKGVSFAVRPGEKVGVVGRTGAGKSSLMLALLRLVEPAAGRVLIDGTDLASIGLADLRSRIAIIPQDPVLFGGSVRENLDPTGRAPDEELWRALELCQLRPLVQALPEGLDGSVAEGGGNLSVGQRQLVCVARAVLRRPRVLLLDEATANIDVETDAQIQRTIRRQFASCTVLTIAHRLNTVMDSDRILVLDKGVLAEFDTPAALLARPDSILAAMVEHTGPEAAAHLRRVANGEVAAFGGDSDGGAQPAPAPQATSLELELGAPAGSTEAP